jgi:uncharacterized protein YbjT (DUF2867 family)
MRVLVTGITGYVGGALAPRLSEEGHDVIGLSRNPGRAELGCPILEGDVASGRGLAQALEGVEVAYYLAHSLESGNDEGFAVRDRRMAHNFVAAARAAGVRRLIHLGVFDVNPPTERSAHQQSRLEIDEIVRSTTKESLTLRAGPLIAAENWYMQAMVNLVRRLPIFILPKKKADGELLLQPIDGRDATECLVRAATSDTVTGRAVDIAGHEIETQREFVETIARLLGKRRRVLHLPFKDRHLSPRLFAAVGGGDPAILKPLYFTALTDNLAHEDGAALLGVKTRSIEESVADTLVEMGFRDGEPEPEPTPAAA